MNHETNQQKFGGWLLALVIVLMYVGPFVSIVSTWGGILQLERQGLNQSDGFGTYKFLTWLVVLIYILLIIRAGWLLKHERQPSTVSAAKKLIWLAAIGGSVLNGIVVPAVSFGANGDVFAAGLVQVVFAAVIAWIYTAYLSKSKRVQVTYGVTRTTKRADSPYVGSSAPQSNEPLTKGAASRSSPSTERVAAAPKPASTNPGTQAMSTIGKVKTENTESPANSETEEQHWAAAMAEVEGEQRRPGVWAKAFAESEGDETKARVAYLKARVQQLTAAAIEAQAAVREEELRQLAEINKQKAEQLRRRNARLAEPELHLAVWDGNWATAARLLRNGMSPSGIDENGKSLLDLAMQRGDRQMVELLKSYGAGTDES